MRGVEITSVLILTVSMPSVLMLSDLVLNVANDKFSLLKLLIYELSFIVYLCLSRLGVP
jgi:hypothetical protein